MKIIKLGVDGDSSSVYDLMTIIDTQGCDDNLVYEIHDLNIDQSKPNSEFINRSTQFYQTFDNKNLVDQWAANDISYATKINGHWYVTQNTGANTYLGGGPTSTLRFREYCYKKGIRLFFIESSLNKWIEDNQPKTKSLPPPLKNKPRLTKTDGRGKRATAPKRKKKVSVEVPEPYNKINFIIEQCGEGVERIVKTASKLTENNYRDLFLAALNSHRQFHFEGESTNRVGRTDLKVRHNKTRDVYIYEFKIHNKTGDINDGLKQITDQYLTTKNKFNGLVLINKKQQDLSLILQTVVRQIKKLKLGVTFDLITPDFNNLKIKVTHKHIRNKTVNCVLTIFLFDIQPSK